MNNSTGTPWHRVLSEFLDHCERIRAPNREDVSALAHRLCQILDEAPDAVREHFEPPPSSIVAQLVERGWTEQILLLTTERVGLMASRAASGDAIATIAVPSLDIERSFSSPDSLAHALTGAIAATALGIVASDLGPADLDDIA